LFEEETDGMYEGLTESYVRVRAKGDGLDKLDGVIRDVTVTGCYGDWCAGVVRKV
jgi:hypothetical protein